MAGVRASGGDIWSRKKMGRVMADIHLDCEGLLCPLPVLRARKVLLGMQTGQVLVLRATDAMAAVDVPHFCSDAGHALLGVAVDGAVSVYSIRRGA
jgi:tRNA 2-thiouridine synthesizing protein A